MRSQLFATQLNLFSFETFISIQKFTNQNAINAFHHIMWFDLLASEYPMTSFDVAAQVESLSMVGAVFDKSDRVSTSSSKQIDSNSVFLWLFGGNLLI